MDKPKKSSHDSSDQSAQFDLAKEELAEIGSKLARIHRAMSEHIFSFDEQTATSQDREHELNILADELERIAILMDEFESSNPFEIMLRIGVCNELNFAKETLRDLSDGVEDLNTFSFIECVHYNLPSVEEAEIVLNLLRAVYAPYAMSPNTYLAKDGTCGYSSKKYFSVDALIPKLQNALDALKECMIGEGFNTFNPEKKGDSMFIGEEIKSILTTIIKTLDETRGDPIERAIRLVSVKLEAVLAIMRNELDLSRDFFYSQVIADVLHREISGGFCLERIKQDKLADDVLPMEELDDALTIIKMVQQIASQQ